MAPYSLTRACFYLLPMLALCLAGMEASPAHSKQLSNEACAQLVNEHAVLIKKGVEDAMNVEPTAAGEKLEAAMIADINRYLFIEGQIRFRCPHIKLPFLKDPTLEKEIEEARQAEAARMEELKRKEQEAEAARKLTAPPDPPAPLPLRKPALKRKKTG